MSVGLDGANEERENMSGGSMNYLYCKLENDADFKQTTPERKAFALHLVKVAKALHDIEWVDSCDYRPGDESEAIRACLAPGMALEAAIEAANEAAKELREELELACAGKRPNAELTERRAEATDKTTDA